MSIFSLIFCICHPEWFLCLYIFKSSSLELWDYFFVKTIRNRRILFVLVLLWENLISKIFIRLRVFFLKNMFFFFFRERKLLLCCIPKPLSRLFNSIFGERKCGSNGIFFTDFKKKLAELHDVARDKFWILKEKQN